MRTEKKIQPDFSTGTGAEIVVPVPRTKGQTAPVLTEDSPRPKVPPRMKKKGPILPEKPPHLRNSPNLSTTASTLTAVSPSQQVTNVKDADLKQQSNNIANPNAIHSKSGFPAKQEEQPSGSQREVLVAASKTGRDRPIERRQREPAKLLTAPPVPKRGEDSEDDDDTGPVIVRIKPRSPKISEPPNIKKSEKSKGAAIFNFRKNRSPMVLIPRGHPLLDSRNLTHMWGGVYPTAYAMWLQSYDNSDNPGSGLLRPIFGSSVDLRPYGVSASHSRGQQRSRADTTGPRSKSPKPPKNSSTSVASSAKPRSSSVTRSGSLTSHGSTSSDSGNETFPKSVLKKQKRNSSKNADRPEQKKNVTFNAFATVQLMEE